MSSSGGSGEGVDDTAYSGRKEGTVTLQYPMLTKSNYAAWSMKMEVYMQAQGVWDAVESETAVESRIDRMAMAAIFQGISEEMLLQLGVRKTAKEAWDALRVMHLGANRVKEVRAQSLKWELESVRMHDSDTIDDFTGKISTIVSKLRSLGEQIDETYVVKKMLRTVSPKFIQIASTIEEFGDLEHKTIDEVIGSLKAHEERLRGHDAKPDERVLLTRTEWKNRAGSSTSHSFPTKDVKASNGRGRGRGRGFDRGRGRGRGRHQGGRVFQEERRKFDISKIRCYNCNEYGHFASDCKEKKEEKAHIVEEVDNEPVLLMAETCELLNSSLVQTEKNTQSHGCAAEKEIDGKGTKWFYDSGASNHMTGCRSLFTDLDESVNGSVRFGDGSVTRIQGRGTVVFECGNEEHISMTNVYYIPKLRSNIISLGQLDESGSRTVIEDGFLKLYNQTGRLMVKVKRAENRLYKMFMKHTQPVCLLAHISEPSWLWHARYGHLSFDALKKLAQ